MNSSQTKIVVLCNNISHDDLVSAFIDILCIILPELPDYSELKMDEFTHATEKKVRVSSHEPSHVKLRTWSGAHLASKKCLLVFLPNHTRIINLSLQNSCILLSFKLAIIRLLLTQASLDPDILQKYQI